MAFACENIGNILYSQTTYHLARQSWYQNNNKLFFIDPKYRAYMLIADAKWVRSILVISDIRKVSQYF